LIFFNVQIVLSEAKRHTFQKKCTYCAHCSMKMICIVREGS